MDCDGNSNKYVYITCRWVALIVCHNSANLMGLHFGEGSELQYPEDVANSAANDVVGLPGVR